MQEIGPKLRVITRKMKVMSVKSIISQNYSIFLQKIMPKLVKLKKSLQMKVKRKNVSARVS